jgi:hypothetical protein
MERSRSCAAASDAVPIGSPSTVVSRQSATAVSQCEPRRQAGRSRPAEAGVARNYARSAHSAAVRSDPPSASTRSAARCATRSADVLIAGRRYKCHVQVCF